jgi:carbonic anhydrase/acetyltransferase-like protein (isoleucine patch superfamily)
VIGEVALGDDSSVWFNTTVRGDVNYIRIGKRTNIQDNSCVHVTRVTHPTLIGSDVTIGHSVTLHGCVLEDACFIGMGATILDGAVVETGAMVAAGALVTPGKRVKAGEVWGGSPAKCLRPMTEAEKEFILVSAQNYVRLAAEYRTYQPERNVDVL